MQPPESNNPASPAPYPITSQEQQATIRRRSLPIAISGAICGLGSLALMAISPIGLNHPPNILAVQLSFCAMMMGIGILFYVRHASGTRAANVFCIIALIAGISGTVVYAVQTVQFQKGNETGEMDRITAIASVARQYAQSHNGNYPLDLATLVEEKQISLDELHSPYEAGFFAWPKSLPPHDALEKLLLEHSDYQYFGTGLKIVDSQGEQAKSDFAHIVIVAKRLPIARKEISLAFGDNHADFVGGENWELIWTRSNDARRSLGFPEVRPPSTSEPAK